MVEYERIEESNQPLGHAMLQIYTLVGCHGMCQGKFMMDKITKDKYHDICQEETLTT